MSHHDPGYAIPLRLREIVLRNLGPQEQPGEPVTRVKMPRTEPQWAAFAARVLAEINSLPGSPSDHDPHDDQQAR